MSEPRYDAETVRKVAAVAARLQSEREARRFSYREEKLTADEMDQIGREVGLDPTLMRQALGYVTAQETAEAARRRPDPSRDRRHPKRGQIHRDAERCRG